MSRKKPPLSEDDLSAWAQASAGVKPFANRKAKVTPAPKRVVAVHTKIAEPVRGTVTLPRLEVNSSPAVDASTHKKFVTGRMEIGGRLDLHGMTQDEAMAALTRFIVFSANEGRRCVLIITGKSGVLRHELPRWLNEDKMRPHILALCEALPKDGGTGAFYALIKRKRALS